MVFVVDGWIWQTRCPLWIQSYLRPITFFPSQLFPSWKLLWIWDVKNIKSAILYRINRVLLWPLKKYEFLRRIFRNQKTEEYFFWFDGLVKFGFEVQFSRCKKWRFGGFPSGGHTRIWRDSVKQKGVKASGCAMLYRIQALMGEITRVRSSGC